MRIPTNAIIPPDKIVKYLLVPRRRNDKSGFLARAGFSLNAPELLEQAIRDASTNHEAVADRSNEHGVYHRVEATMVGPNGVAIDVVLIWIEWKTDGSFHFVTLKPAKRRTP
jgi:hypothetical protein